MRYRFEGLKRGGAYFRNFTVCNMYLVLLFLSKLITLHNILQVKGAAPRNLPKFKK